MTASEPAVRDQPAVAGHQVVAIRMIGVARLLRGHDRQVVVEHEVLRETPPQVDQWVERSRHAVVPPHVDVRA